MPFVILAIALVLLLVFGPQYWVKQVLARHGGDRPDLPGTGGELARHLLDEAGLRDVTVELTGDGDHYDPDDRVVRLTPAHHDGRSVAAVAVAAHEVSHAVQHARGERAFDLRLRLVKRLSIIDTVATVILVSAPLLAFILRAPALFFVQLACGIALLAIRVAVHVATLPVEFDASFGKALPILEAGRYLEASDMPAARRVLKAAAYTYVAAALATLLDVMRWLRILRF
jgi:Zn-dependent membrane protease YugP